MRPEELGALLWVLEKAADPQYRLKLGMGKPYGLGSIAIHSEVSLTDRVARYGNLFNGDEWNLGELPPEKQNPKIEAAKKQFSEWVLKNKLINPDDAKSIEDLPRIKELLALLNWQSRPSEDKTRYMELKEFTGQKNIFPELQGRPSRRPVLPAATQVADNQWFGKLPEEEPRFRTNAGASSRGPRKDSQVAEPTPAAPRTFVVPKAATPPSTKRERPAKAEKSKPVEKAPSKLVKGDVIRAVVDEDTPARHEVSFTIPLGGEEDIAVLPASENTFRRYKKGEKVLLRIVKIAGDAKRGYKFTCEAVE